MLRLMNKPASSQTIAERIAAAEATIAAAQTRVPALRAEDADIERQISDLLGEQIAEGHTGHRAAIAAARQRRRDIGTQIEELEGRARASRDGLKNARILAQRARIREERERANEARRRLVTAVDSVITLLPTLVTLNTEINECAEVEWNAWRMEGTLRAELDQRDMDGAPHSGVLSAVGDANLNLRTGYALGQAFEVLSAHGSIHDLAPAITRLTKLAADARTANDTK
jgi:hypothetical protein